MAARRSTIIGRRADLAAADDAGGVARAALGVGDLDAHDVVERRSLGVERKIGGHLIERVLHGGSVHGAHLAGHAHHGEAVGAIRRDLEVEHGIGHLQIIGDRLAGRCIVGKDPDALVVVAYAQFALGAAHAAAHDAAQFGLLDLEVARQNRADRGGGD